MWSGELHISHWVYSEDTSPRTVMQAISRLDPLTRLVRACLPTL
jgi:hypothetical protein